MFGVCEEMILFMPMPSGPVPLPIAIIFCIWFGQLLATLLFGKLLRFEENKYDFCMFSWCLIPIIGPIISVIGYFIIEKKEKEDEKYWK